MHAIRPAVLMFLFISILCGGIYPALVTGVARIFFPDQAEGSFLADRTGRVIGSKLIGQQFTDPKYLWPRPSATVDFAYNPMASGGSNRSPANQDYLEDVAGRVRGLRTEGIHGPIAADLVQASGSGLDPHLSPEAAAVQTRRIARARGLGEERVAAVLGNHLDGRQFGFLGAPRINVLAVNLELDAISQDASAEKASQPPNPPRQGNR